MWVATTQSVPGALIVPSGDLFNHGGLRAEADAPPGELGPCHSSEECYALACG